MDSLVRVNDGCKRLGIAGNNHQQCGSPPFPVEQATYLVLWSKPHTSLRAALAWRSEAAARIAFTGKGGEPVMRGSVPQQRHGTAHSRFFATSCGARQISPFALRSHGARKTQQESPPQEVAKNRILDRRKNTVSVGLALTRAAIRAPSSGSTISTLAQRLDTRRQIIPGPCLP